MGPTDELTIILLSGHLDKLTSKYLYVVIGLMGAGRG